MLDLHHALLVGQTVHVALEVLSGERGGVKGPGGWTDWQTAQRAQPEFNASPDLSWGGDLHAALTPSKSTPPAAHLLRKLGLPLAPPTLRCPLGVLPYLLIVASDVADVAEELAAPLSGGVLAVALADRGPPRGPTQLLQPRAEGTALAALLDGDLEGRPHAQHLYQNSGGQHAGRRSTEVPTRPSGVQMDPNSPQSLCFPPQIPLPLCQLYFPLHPAGGSLAGKDLLSYKVTGNNMNRHDYRTTVKGRAFWHSE